MKKSELRQIIKEEIKNIQENQTSLIKIGDTIKHNLTGAEILIDKINGNNIEGKITKLGTLKGAKVGDRNKTSSLLVGKSYKILESLSESINPKNIEFKKTLDTTINLLKSHIKQFYGKQF